MASAINNGTFTFSKKEVDDWSKVIHELGFMSTELSKLHTVDTGIKYDEQIVLSSNKGLLGKKVTGCTPNEISGVTLSEKVWQPVFEDFRLTHCSADANQQDKLVNQMSKMNPDFYDIFSGSQSKTGAFLVASVLERFNEEIVRKAWFNDKAALTVTGGGNITDGTDLGYFNTFNGFFKQFMSNATLVANNRVTITENAGANYAAQSLADGDGKKYLRAVYMKADMRLRAHKDAQFYVTQTVFDQYVTDLENAQSNGAGNTMITENGITTVRFRGIPVTPMHIWDRIITEYEDNETKLNKPNRIFLSTPDNLRIGTLATEDFESLEAFYDKVTKKNYIDGVYSIDSKIIEDYLVAAAY